MSINEKVMVLFPEHPYMKNIQTAIDAGQEHGILDCDDLIEDETLWLNHPDVTFISRKYAESCEDYRQLIPYMAIARFNKDGQPEVLVYKRKPSKGQVDPRLNRKWSIGIGGHINLESSEDIPDPANATMLELIIDSALREFKEEVKPVGQDEFSSYDFRYKHQLYTTGNIYDNTNAIGRVHIGHGLLLLLMGEDKDNLEFEANEEGIEIIGFKGREFFEELFKSEEGLEESVLETWSLDYVKHLFGFDGRPAEFIEIERMSIEG